MIKEKEVEVKTNAKTTTYYRSLGYECNKFDVIRVKIDDLTKGSHVKIHAICDYCGKEKELKYQDYINSVENGGKYCCGECKSIKQREVIKTKYNVDSVVQIPGVLDSMRATNLIRYGTENPSSSPIIKEKKNKTNMERRGVSNPMQDEKVREKAYSTNELRFGVKHPAQNKDVQKRMQQTNLERHGCKIATQSPIIRKKLSASLKKTFENDRLYNSSSIAQKRNNTLYNNNNGPTSIQQKYLSNLFGGKLNYPVKQYLLDIAFPDMKVYTEYDGGGHSLTVLLGKITQEEFDKQEIRRFYSLRNCGWKLIRIISPHDKLPSEETLLRMRELSLQYFKDYPNHSWFEWRIDEGIYRNAEHREGVLFDYGELHTVKSADLVTCGESIPSLN